MMWETLAAIEGIFILIILFGGYRLIRKLKEARHLSLEDPLTGIGNRRKLDIAFHNAHVSACRAFFPRNKHQSHSFPIAVMIMDMDGLKQMNDLHGHAVGDALIRELAKKMTRNVRETDTVSRIGGDEFCLFFMNVSEETCVEIARRISEDFRGYEYISGMKNPPTISAGLCVSESEKIVDSPGKIREILDKADQRLRMAKASGKNRLIGNKDVSVSL